MKRVLAFSLVLLVVAGCAVATVLPDGRVLFMNGLAKIYDPSSGVLRNSTIPTPNRAWNSLTLLNDGHVLLAGGVLGSANPTGGAGAAASPAASGSSSEAATATASLYDPATDTYKDTGSMAQGRVLHTATLLQDGKVLVVGGAGAALNLDPTGSDQSSSAPLATAELYDPGSGTFSATGSLATGRSFQTATLLQDGKVLIVGGTDATNKSLATAELYDPASGTFSPTGSMTDLRSFHTATLLQDGKVLVVGGLSSSSGSGSSAADPATTSAELYDPSSGTFTKIAAPLVSPRALHTATLLQDGKVLIAGGLDTGGGGAMLASAELYDPATQTFTKTGDLNHGHAFHAAALLPDGKVIIAGFAGSLTDMLGGSLGGLGGGTATPPPNASDPLGGAELYDPATGTWSDVQVEPGVMPSFGSSQQTEAPATEPAPSE
jgi:hypothetical protein